MNFINTCGDKRNLGLQCPLDEIQIRRTAFISCFISCSWDYLLEDANRWYSCMQTLPLPLLVTLIFSGKYKILHIVLLGFCPAASMSSTYEQPFLSVGHLAWWPTGSHLPCHLCVTQLLGSLKMQRAGLSQDITDMTKEGLSPPCCL